jgi:hypothetical protein
MKALHIDSKRSVNPAVATFLLVAIAGLGIAACGEGVDSTPSEKTATTSAALTAANAPAYIGCFGDQGNTDLSGAHETSATNTPEQCVAWCASQGFLYAGVENDNQCGCGNSYGKYGTSSSCTDACPGNFAEVCGGSSANSVYRTSALPSIGCFADENSRDLSGPQQVSSSSQTPEQCVAWCSSQGFAYAGVQDYNQCFCGNSYGKYGPSTGCNEACTGDSTQNCGGGWANAVYRAGPIGCFADQNTRDLNGPSETSSSVTAEQCVSWCGSQGYAYAGAQDGNQCFCGNSFGAYGSSTGCNDSCAGDNTQNCGGSWANSVYRTASPIYVGCFGDNPTRDLPSASQTSTTDTPEQCVAWCGSQGYAYAGAQDGNQCFCGNSYGQYGASNNCNVTCSGSAQTCGGSYANSVYQTGARGPTLQTYGNIDIDLATGCDDARSDSVVTVQVFAGTDSPTPGASLLTYTLKPSGISWGNWTSSDQNLALPSPQTKASIGNVVVTLTTHDGFAESDDDWNIQGVNISLDDNAGHRVSLLARGDLSDTGYSGCGSYINRLLGTSSVTY